MLVRIIPSANARARPYLGRAFFLRKRVRLFTAENARERGLRSKKTMKIDGAHEKLKGGNAEQTLRVARTAMKKKACTRGYRRETAVTTGCPEEVAEDTTLLS